MHLVKTLLKFRNSNHSKYLLKNFVITGEIILFDQSKCGAKFKCLEQVKRECL